MANVVEARGLTKRFSDRQDYRALLRFRRRESLTAVDAVSLEIGEGELYGLLGPNGAGKTTLIKMLCTLVLPSEGRAWVCGRDVVAEEAAIKPLIGLIDCQERSFFWRLSGRQNLQFFAALSGLRGSEANARISALLDLVGLRAHADRRYMGYSAGMRQRLAVARGLLSNPRVVFMDEPTRSLDPVAAHELRRFIRGTLVDGMGHTVVLVTHHLEEAEELCDRVAIMNHGQIVACGSVAQIVQLIPARQRYRLRVRSVSPASLDRLRALPGVLEVRANGQEPDASTLDMVLSDERETLPEVMRLLVSQGVDVQHCQAEGLSLEEAFVHLVKEGGDGV